MKSYIRMNNLSNATMNWLDGREYISHRTNDGEVFFTDLSTDSERSYRIGELMETSTHYVGWSVSIKDGDAKSIIVPKPIGDNVLSWYTEEQFFRCLVPVEFDGTEMENSLVEAWLRTMPGVVRGEFLAWVKEFSEYRYPGTKEALDWIQNKY